MAASSTDTRVERDLRALGAVVSDLRETAAYYRDRPRQRLTLGMEWSDDLTRLRGLDEAYRAGRMSEAQTQRYQRLLRELRAAQPYLVELGWELPDVRLFRALAHEAV